MNHDFLTREQEELVTTLSEKMGRTDVVHAVALLLTGIQIGRQIEGKELEK